MDSIEWSLPAAFDVIAAAAPDRDMLVWKDTRRTYAEVAARTRNLAAFLQRRGIGSRRERSELERWECGQATVALLLYNCPEYVEAMLGCFRARAVPFNVNQHYRPEEIRHPARHGRSRGGRLPPRARSARRRRGEGAQSPAAPCRGRIRASRRSPGARASRTPSTRTPISRASPPRLPTISTSCAREARPARRRVCSGARATSSSRRWAAARRASSESLAARAVGGSRHLVRGAAA